MTSFGPRSKTERADEQLFERRKSKTNMSAPINGTKTRVVGFLKGLFGRNHAEAAPAQDDVVYNYNQELPITGAQLKAPAPASAPTTNSAQSVKPNPVRVSSVHSPTAN